MNTKKLYFWIGVALILDSILSLYWGNFKADEFIGSFGMMSNSTLGNIVRIARGGAGVLLVAYNK